MDSIASVTNSIQLSGTQLMGKTVMVQASQADRNEILTASTKQQPTRLYVGSLHLNITEQDVENIFSEFGEVDFVDLHREPETGVSKGFAFVQFRDPEAAKRALVQVNGRELAGKPIKVGLVNAVTGKPNATGDLDEEGGMSLDAQSRAVLMAKLQKREDDVLSPKGPNCLVLQNMFSEEEAKDPSFEEEIKEDVKEECTKYGTIANTVVDISSENGSVWIHFDKSASATKAYEGLNGRWFGGRMITCEYKTEVEFYQKYPSAKKAGRH